jgi:hypothetical protein
VGAGLGLGEGGVGGTCTLGLVRLVEQPSLTLTLGRIWIAGRRTIGMCTGVFCRPTSRHTLTQQLIII